MTRITALLPLVLCFVLLAFPVAAQQPATIDFGETVEGELDGQHPTQAYTFSAEAGQIVSITLLSDDFDALVVLLDPQGHEIAYNDDGGPGSLNSRIGPLALAESGEYTIVANSYDNYFSYRDDAIASGRYTLILEAVEIRRIEYTQVVKDEITAEQQTAYFQFRGQAGDVVNVSAETRDFSANLTLSLLNEDASTMQLTSSSDYSGQGVALIGGYMLHETANYLITLTSASSAQSEFTLEVERLQVIALPFDSVVDVVLDEDNRLSYFSFEAEAGAVISLTVSGDGAFDSTLTLNGPDGYQVAYSDDANGRDPAIINQILPQTGIYTVIVQPYSTGNTGEVTLLLERGTLLSLDEGRQVVTFGGARTRETFTLTGSAGDEIRLVVTLQDNTTGSPSVTMTQNQSSIAYASSSTVRRLAVDFVVPAQGLIFVEVEEFGSNEASMTVSAERLNAPLPPAAPTATPTPATLPTEVPATEEAEATEALATETVDDGFIDITQEPLLPPIPTEEATEAAEAPTEVVAETAEPEVTEAAA